MRYRLRTLLILLAILPPLLWFGWTKYEVWRAEQERQAHQRLWLHTGQSVAAGTVMVDAIEVDTGPALVGGAPAK